MAGTTVATWVKVKNSKGLTSRPISHKYEGGVSFEPGQVITMSEYQKLKSEGNKKREERKNNKISPQWNYEEYSPFARQLAKDYSREELEKQRDKFDGQRSKLAGSHLSAVQKTSSMSSQSQRRAQSRNSMTGNYEDYQHRVDALEIYRYYPQHTKDAKLKASAIAKKKEKALKDNMRQVNEEKDKTHMVRYKKNMAKRFEDSMNQGVIDRKRYDELLKEFEITPKDIADGIKAEKRIKQLQNAPLQI